ncbi:MAG: hypothetical protein BWX68_03010 [Verrucomicrobia bacterium ADurb.Bin063]|nr:MAG: hypothetical protein BWX68_03010 [Verrucomicrobia bacterium ADurb.Bin063]
MGAGWPLAVTTKLVALNAVALNGPLPLVNTGAVGVAANILYSVKFCMLALLL